MFIKLRRGNGGFLPFMDEYGFPGKKDCWKFLDFQIRTDGEKLHETKQNNADLTALIEIIKQVDSGNK